MELEKNQRILFAEFELDARRRQFLRAGELVSLNAKAFDLLFFLAKNSGRVISKDEIIDSVWNDQIVEESNLTVQISALRAALGEKASKPRLLVTIPGTGYQFVADVRFKEFPSINDFEKDFPGTPGQAPASSEPKNPEVPESKKRYRGILAGIVVLSIFFAAFMIWRSYFLPPQSIDSIAVLPFIERNSDSSSDYLSDGLSESVIFSLSKIPNLKVLSRNSTFQYRGADVDAQKIGRELGVASILTGTVTRTADSIVINAELVSTSDNSVIWGEQFPRKLDDMEKLQVDIAQSIARQLRLKLAVDDERLLEKSQTADHEAFQHYLAGRYHLNRLTDDGFLKGRDSFKAAIAKDSKYALAHAGLAESLNLLSGWGSIAPNDGFPLAKSAAIRALELDENLAEAHTQLGIVKLFYDLNLDAAEFEFKKAIEINPSYSDAYHMHSYSLAARGKYAEARASVNKSRELDPLSILKLVTVGNLLLWERNTDEAVVQYQNALEMDPNSGLVRWSLGNAHLQAKRFPQAIKEYEAAIRLSGDSPEEPTGLALASAFSGNTTEARNILEKLTNRSKNDYVPTSLLAAIHGALGESDKAFDLLNKAVRERDPMLLFLKVDPYFDQFRSDQRFEELQKSLRLE